MLKITLKQFLGISGLVEDTMDKFNISCDLTPYVELYIGDPDKNGNIVIDYKGPRGLFIISEQEYRKLGCDERKRILYQGSVVKYA